MKEPKVIPLPKSRAGRKPRLAIRPLDRPDEYDKLLDIQRRVWKHTETDLTPLHQFRITSRLGAILLGGYIEGRLVGFVYSFPAIFEGRLIQHSHLLAVLPEFQGCGVGKSLKWAQRDLAIDLGYDLITWTFDPLQARNANLNLHTLGAIARTYWPDFYGNQAALLLGPNVRTDRFLAEWRIREKAVERRRRGEYAAYDPRGMARALERRAPPEPPAAARSGAGGSEKRGCPGAGWMKTPAGVTYASRSRSPERFRADAEVPSAGVNGARGFPYPARPRLSLDPDAVLAEVPRSVNAMKERPEAIAAWQQALRAVFRRYFARGYVVVDFIFGDRSFYVFQRGSASR